MKKLIIALLSLLFIAVFCACTEETNEVSRDFSNNNGGSSLSSETGVASGSESSKTVSDESSDNSDAESSNPVNDSSNNQNNNQSGDNSDSSNGETSNGETSNGETSNGETSNGETSGGETSGGENSSTPPDDNNQSDDNQYPDIGDAELLPTGYLIYDGAAYTSTHYSSENARRYANVYAQYVRLFPNTRINVINPPLSAINIKNPHVAAMVNDQGEVLDKMESQIYGDVNFVNLKNTFLQHQGEYLYFKSDYHWTQLGAYYAYCDFARSVGLTPTPLESFTCNILSTDFIGRANDYACDDRINSFYDTIYAYMPRKAHTMTIYQPWGESALYDNCVLTSIKSYSCFINGDNAFTVIDVPENDADKSVLVIKESSANAFVPFLTEHYGKIYVIDPRAIEYDIRDFVAEKGIDDIIFFAMASTSNRSAYAAYYERMIGL